MPPARTTMCGYGIADVRKNLRDAIDRRDFRAAGRWTAELVATPGAIGSLWASYWSAWAAAQGAGSVSPTLPILLDQTWNKMVPIAQQCGRDWSQFRNNEQVRAVCHEMTKRLLTQNRPTPVVWPSKDIVFHDVSTMRSATSIPAATDSPIILRVWNREEDALELRMMAGRWVDALQRGDLRLAMSAFLWTMMTPQQQGLAVPAKCGARGPAELTPKQQKSPIWFWLEIGKSWFASRQGIHRGWPTFHTTIANAMRTHYLRFTQVERMRLMLGWMLQIRASLTPQAETIWMAPPLQQTLAEIDLPYREIAAELADPNNVVMAPEERNKPPPLTEKEKKKLEAAQAEAKLREADEKIMAFLGLGDD
jgi:hypothetical protein